MQCCLRAKPLGGKKYEGKKCDSKFNATCSWPWYEQLKTKEKN